MKTNLMKQSTIVILFGLLIGSCGNKQNSSNANWDDLESLRLGLQTKQQELKEINLEIDRINERINELDTSEKPKRLVTVDTVIASGFKHFVDFQGTVQSDEIVNISSEMGGRIVRLLIKEGQLVSRGQLIARMDSETLERQLEEIETSLSLATTVFERQSRLWEQKIGSEFQYLEAKNNKERLENSKSTLQSQLVKSKVYAPASGVVERLMLNEGEFAGPGAPIGVIVNIKRIKVVANLPESYIGVVKKGDNVMISFPTLGLELSAKVDLVGKTILEGNRTFRVEAFIPQTKDDLFKPNLLAKMKVNDYSLAEAIVIPVELLQQEASGKQFVFTVSDNGNGLKAAKRYIETGKIFEDKILVSSGLEVGDVVIMIGSRGLSNNELIEIQ
jgi:membrane fusion protein, multidrug efflux system